MPAHPVMTFRLPENLIARLDREARAGDRSRSAQIARFIREGLDRLERDRAARTGGT